MPKAKQPAFVLPKAAPFYLCYVNLVLFVPACIFGGFWLLPNLIFNFVLIGFFDEIAGLFDQNADPNTPEENLFWHRLAILLWLPTQIIMSLGGLYYTTQIADHSVIESWMVMLLAGLSMGGVGIVFAHEMMHQKPALERHMADILMSMTLYGHFRSEHLLVHHRYVGTPIDAVTARYGEGFWRFFIRVLPESFKSAWRAEVAKLGKRGLSAWSLRNPFWKYGTISVAFLLAAYLIGGLWGVVLYIHHAFVAVLLLEVINYIEHYGLTREYLGNGKYEHVKPQHAWNAAHKYSNFLLVNLQRHSDHHFKPERRYPLLQNYSADEAPQLPFGYPIMVGCAFVPRFWKSRMNPRVRAWRQKFYPHIEDWTAYNEGSNPAPSR